MKITRSVAIVGGMFLLAGVVAVFVWPRLHQENLDLQTRIAAVFHVKREFVHINLPPAAGRYPGSVFYVEDSWLPVKQVESSDPDLKIGPEYSLSWQTTISAAGSGEFGYGVVGDVMKGDAVGDVELQIAQARTIEIPTAALKQHLLSSGVDKAHYDAAIVVTRSYEGIPTLKIHRRSSTSVQAWGGTKKTAENTEGKNGVAKVNFDSKNDDVITIEMSGRVVVAFELARAHFVASSLGPIDDVNLTPITSAQVSVKKKE